MKPWLAAGLMVAGVAGAADLPTEQRLELLERRIGKLTELTLQLDALRRENRELRGETERLGFQLEELRRQQRDIYQDIDQRLGALAGQPAVNALSPTDPGEPAAAAASVTAAPVAVVPADRGAIEAEYQAAYALLSPQRKAYAEAADAFAAFLDRYPEDPLAANAHYWMGEAFYVSQRNVEARSAFETVVAKYPDSSKAPGALFKIARLQQAAGENDAARESYRQVLARYPDSAAAGLARQRLEQMGG